MYVIGLMSGTSLDGVDAALCDIHGCGEQTALTLLDFQNYAIPEELREEIKRACSYDQLTTGFIASLNFKLGTLFSEIVGKLCLKNQLMPSELAFVASHGQTVYHQPFDDGAMARCTLQIGESSIIAYDHGVDVISDFRVMDMAAGGEGAPLVPHAEVILYGKMGRCLALQNIGGIGNVSLLNNHEIVSAFDTGPGNMMIDEAMKVLFQKDYDKNGEVAAQGVVSAIVLDELMQHAFLSKQPPKSTGREMFGEFYTRELLARYPDVAKADMIATLTMFTAKSIAANYEAFIFPKYQPEQVLIGGGGAYNKTLLKFLQELLPQTKVVTQEDVGYSSDAKEAIAFAVLGNETYHGKASNVPRATGAKELVVLGKFTPNPLKGLRILEK